MAYQLPYQPRKSTDKNFLENEVHTVSLIVNQLIATSSKSFWKLVHFILGFALYLVFWKYVYEYVHTYYCDTTFTNKS